MSFSVIHPRVISHQVPKQLFCIMSLKITLKLLPYLPGADELRFIICCYWVIQHINGLVQDCSNSSANALELLQSCTKPSVSFWLCWQLPPVWGYHMNTNSIRSVFIKLEGIMKPDSGSWLHYAGTHVIHRDLILQWRRKTSGTSDISDS